MFKLIAVIMALCASSEAVSSNGSSSGADDTEFSGSPTFLSNLYITDDIYMLAFLGHYMSYSSSEMEKAGYLGISISKDFVGVNNIDCEPKTYKISEFSSADPQASRLLNSSIEIMNKTLLDRSQKSMVVSLYGSSIVIEKLNGFPKPKRLVSRGYDITVLADGHCVVKGRDEIDAFQALVINKHIIYTVLDSEVLNEGRDCLLDDATQKVFEEVKAIAGEC